MRAKKSKKSVGIVMLVMSLAILGGGLAAANHFNEEIEAYQRSEAAADAAFRAHILQPFINSAKNAEPYRSVIEHDDALYYFESPEGFRVISHSAAWNQNMLDALSYELKQNVHGHEMETLYEIVINPHEGENMLASFTPGTTAESFFFQFPAFPEEFVVRFPRDIGRINLYDGDENITIESIAGSLSHEYGHLYTFYHMFNIDLDEDDSLAGTRYAELREASKHDLVTNISPGDDYLQERHRYLFEVAAEDYVQLMGSPTTRQVVDFVDVQQMINGAQPPENIRGARNAFPQENMMLPLAIDVPGLAEYFFSFIGVAPRVPIEEKQEVTLEIQRNVVEYNLVTGPRTFIYHTITWNTPYQNAIYTLACYDPHNYSGWGHPIKTVHPGETASAVIGEYVVQRGQQIVSMDDGLAEGFKVFYVVAQLPDGTYYISNKLEVQF